jgi:hypothetical protein
MDHMQFLVERASEPEGEFCGHALMASCPPEAHPENHPGAPFGHTTHLRDDGVAQKTWDISKTDLANLLDLSKRLNLDGEITPVSTYTLTSNPVLDVLEGYKECCRPSVQQIVLTYF